MKRVSTVLALALGACVTFSSAAQIQGFVSGYAPGNVQQKKTAKGIDTNTDLNSDISFGFGGEFLVFPAGPLMVGGGLGLFSVQKDGDNNIVMPSIPLWGSVGVIGPEEWGTRPYFEARIGYPIPATNYITWWRSPLNFFATVAVGAQLPYNVGIELDWTYLTMNKKFEDLADVNFRLSSMKFGGSITVHFDLFGGSASAKKKSDEWGDIAAEPTAEPAAESSSSESENTEPASYEDYYSSYSDSSTEQPAEEPVAEEPAAEPVAEETAEPAAEETPAEEPAAEEPAQAEEASAEEAPAEETPAEEAVAEPAAEEPVAEEVAPEPAPKPAAKKASKKKSSKKTTKKTATKKKSKAKSKKKR